MLYTQDLSRCFGSHGLSRAAFESRLAKTDAALKRLKTQA